MRMPEEGITAPASLPRAAVAHKATLANPAQTAQRVHAWAIFVVPLIGVAATAWLGVVFGVSAFDVALFALMYFLTFTGITVGFHRLLSHRSFQTVPAVKAALAIFGSMAMQGPPIYWVSNHRRHHQHSDQPGDPHSPHFDGDTPLRTLRGLWHAQIRWTYKHELTNTIVFAKELLRDPLISRINRLYYLWAALGLLVPTVIGGIYHETWFGALSGFLWGGMARLFMSYHAANSINSITHLFGRRPFNTREKSRNTLWLILPTFGEAWHNNHHAFPTSAIFGLKWWQIDIGGLVIRALEKARLVRDVKKPSAKTIAERQRELARSPDAADTPYSY